MARSVNAEIDLEPGRYQVLMKITAYRHDEESTEETVRRLASTHREKLVQVGLSYDLAHAKGLVAETDQERYDSERRKACEWKKLRDETKRKLQKEWIRERKMAARQQRQAARRPRRMTNGASPDRGPISGQILADNKATQSPIEVGSISSDVGDRRPATNGTSGSVPTIQFNGLHARHASCGSTRRRAESPRPSLNTRLANDNLDITDLELLDGFEFDSDLDMPIEEPKNRPPFPDLEGPAEDPWNAVCVVGLRVYSQDPKLSLQVMHPIPEDDTEAPLDRDDPAASATLEKSFWSGQIPA